MGTSTPGSWPPINTAEVGPTLSRRQRVTRSTVVIVMAIAVGIGIWLAAVRGGDSDSHPGCVTLILASSTGGARLHQCGEPARTLCHSAYIDNDKIALLIRPQCRLAGL